MNLREPNMNKLSQTEKDVKEEVGDDSISEVQKRSFMKMFRMFKKSLGAQQKRNSVPMLG